MREHIYRKGSVKLSVQTILVTRPHELFLRIASSSVIVPVYKTVRQDTGSKDLGNDELKPDHCTNSYMFNLQLIRFWLGKTSAGTVLVLLRGDTSLVGFPGGISNDIAGLRHL